MGPGPTHTGGPRRRPLEAAPGATCSPLVDEVVCSGDFTVPAGAGFAALAGIRRTGWAPGWSRRRTDAGAIELSVEGRRSRVPVPSVTAVDTLGAGDVLHGAYAFYRAQGCDAEAALAAAAGVASFRCGIAGSRGWVEAWPNT